MPHTIRFTDEGVEARLTGALTPAEIAEVQSKIREHSFPRQLRWELVDLSGAQGSRITSVVVERAAERDQQYLQSNPKFAVALVATNPLLFGLARMYEGYMGEVSEVRVFAARSDAVAWLADFGAAPADISAEP